MYVFPAADVATISKFNGLSVLHDMITKNVSIRFASSPMKGVSLDSCNILLILSSNKSSARNFSIVLTSTAPNVESCPRYLSISGIFTTSGAGTYFASLIITPTSNIVSLKSCFSPSDIPAEETKRVILCCDNKLSFPLGFPSRSIEKSILPFFDERKVKTTSCFPIITVNLLALSVDCKTCTDSSISLIS